MSIQNLVSATLAADKQQNILAKLADIRDNLDFLVTLDADQRRTLFKAKNGFRPFIEKAYSLCEAHPEIIPGFLSLDELGKDVALIESLRPIQSMVHELAKALDDTMIAANSDALRLCLDVYASVKLHRDKVPGLSTTQQELALFFQRTPRKSASTGPA
ncbi:MAG: hypothetical protein IPK50_12840 [Fibrobacterota bacterium]|nr:hypothetical protein [Fibrobacterota bacterium]QQS03195.1 MAG: hypothetical protein IPK50_12840 [Fibrobacterota bacterium]